jgi:hypothetical protein
VLHQGQIMQCSHCLRRADSCPGGGRGKYCKEKGTRRGEIADYMRHLKVHHNYTSLKMKFREEFPQLNNSTPHNDGFEDMKEGVDEDQACIIDRDQPKNRDMILSLQKQLSEANLAREQQIHEIAKLKASITKQEESMKVDINKSLTGQINIGADNFEYDDEADTLRVIDTGN